MKIKQAIIEVLMRNRVSRLRLALVLDFSELWIDKLIAANKENGPLTTLKAIEVIAEETGVIASEVVEERKLVGE